MRAFLSIEALAPFAAPPAPLLAPPLLALAVHSLSAVLVRFLGG
jgi:hypothetical protein